MRTAVVSVAFLALVSALGLRAQTAIDALRLQSATK